jgi:hypothetical protein
VVGASVFSFGIGLVVGAVLWGGFDWHRRHVTIVNVHNFNTFNRTRITDGTWRHDVVHRRGVPYHDPGIRQRFGQGPLPGAGAREAFRGRVRQAPQQLAPSGAGARPGGGSAPGIGRTPQSGIVGPQAPRLSPPPAAFEGLGRGGETRSFSDRGRASRMGTGAAKPAPSGPSAPAGGGRPAGGGGRK